MVRERRLNGREGPHPIIGRCRELGRLSKGLDEALHGTGKILIVEGAAGVGKTRTLEELAHIATGKGCQVIRCGGQPNEAHPYQLFEEAFRGRIEVPLVPKGIETRFSELFAVSNSGMLIAQASSGAGVDIDKDIMAGMLTAVQSFVQDSLDKGCSAGPGLKRVEYKEKKILLEYGQDFYIAGVIEGEEHEGMRYQLAATAEQVGSEFGEALTAWGGRMDQVAGMEGTLERLLAQRWSMLRSAREVSTEVERLKIFETGLRALEGLAASGPLLLIAEDLHWADEDSLGMMLYLARNGSGGRISIMASARPEHGAALDKFLKKSSEEGLHEWVNLAGLDGYEVRALVEDVLGGRPSEELMANLSAKCEGNPLFAKELLETAVGEGKVFVDGEEWTLRPGDSLSADSIEELISRRIKALPTAAFHSLDICACLGLEFGDDILASCLGVPPSQIDGQLEQLVSGGILMRAGGRARFAHALMREVAYEAVGYRKCSYHGAIAASLEKASAENPDRYLYELAGHYGFSDNWPKSIDFNSRAGDRASSEGSPERAVDYYETALEALSSARSEVGSTFRRLYLLERRGDACTMGGLFAKALESYFDCAILIDGTDKARMLRKRGEALDKMGRLDEALKEFELAEASLSPNDQGEWGRIAISKAAVLMGKGEYDQAISLASKAEHAVSTLAGEDAEREKARGWNVLGVSHHDRGDYDIALGYYKKLAETKERLKDGRGLYLAYNNIGILEFNKGNYSDALAYIGKAADIVGRSGDQQGLAVTYNNAGLVHFSEGDFAKARDSWERCAKIFRRIGDINGMAASDNNAGIMQQYLGEHDKALKLLFQSLSARERTGDKRGEAGTANSIADVYKDMGDYPRALEFFSRSIEICRQVGGKELMVTNLCGRIETMILQGNLGVAESDLAEAVRLSSEVGEKVNDYRIERIRAMMASSRGDWEMAETAFNKAEAGQAAANMALEVATTRFEMGRMLARKGEKERALAVLKSAMESFEARGMLGLANRCKRAIEAILG